MNIVGKLKPAAGTFRRLCMDGVQSIGLEPGLPTCGIYGVDWEQFAADAAKRRITHQLDGFTALGTPLGSAEYVSIAVSPCSCQAAAKPRNRALAGKKGIVECQRRGDTVAVMPRLELAAVDVVVAHASAKSYAAQAARTAGCTAARAERTKRRDSGRMYRIMLLSGSCRLRLTSAGTWARMR